MKTSETVFFFEGYMRIGVGTVPVIRVKGQVEGLGIPGEPFGFFARLGQPKAEPLKLGAGVRLSRAVSESRPLDSLSHTL